MAYSSLSFSLPLSNHLSLSLFLNPSFFVKPTPWLTASSLSSPSVSLSLSTPSLSLSLILYPSLSNPCYGLQLALSLPSPSVSLFQSHLSLSIHLFQTHIKAYSTLSLSIFLLPSLYHMLHLSAHSPTLEKRNVFLKRLLNAPAGAFSGGVPKPVEAPGRPIRSEHCYVIL